MISYKIPPLTSSHLATSLIIDKILVYLSIIGLPSQSNDRYDRNICFCFAFFTGLSNNLCLRETNIVAVQESNSDDTISPN